MTSAYVNNADATAAAIDAAAGGWYLKLGDVGFGSPSTTAAATTTGSPATRRCSSAAAPTTRTSRSTPSSRRGRRRALRHRRGERDRAARRVGARGRVPRHHRVQRRGGAEDADGGRRAGGGVRLRRRRARRGSGGAKFDRALSCRSRRISCAVSSWSRETKAAPVGRSFRLVAGTPPSRSGGGGGRARASARLTSPRPVRERKRGSRSGKGVCKAVGEPGGWASGRPGGLSWNATMEAGTSASATARGVDVQLAAAHIQDALDGPSGLVTQATVRAPCSPRLPALRGRCGSGLLNVQQADTPDWTRNFSPTLRDPEMACIRVLTCRCSRTSRYRARRRHAGACSWST